MEIKRCDWCGKESHDLKLYCSDDGDNCCNACINKANENAKPIKENNDINYLDRNELIAIVYNISDCCGGHYSKDDLNDMIMHYRRNK